MKNLVEIIILFVFFPTINPTKNTFISYQKSVSFLSVFDFLGLTDPHFQELDFFCVCQNYGVISLLNLKNLLSKINRIL